jgi:hypothetical protein
MLKKILWRLKFSALSFINPNASLMMLLGEANWPDFKNSPEFPSYSNLLQQSGQMAKAARKENNTDQSRDELQPLDVLLGDFRFAQKAIEANKSVNFNLVVAHDPLSAISGKIVADYFKCKLVIDCVEDIDVSRRSGEYYRREFSGQIGSFYQSLLDSAFQSADTIIYVSPAQKLSLEHKFPHAMKLFIPNYRDKSAISDQVFQRARQKLTDLGISDSKFAVIASKYAYTESNIDAVCEIVETLNKRGVAVVHVGHPEQEMKKRTGSAPVEYGYADYQEYLAVLSLSQFSIIPFDAKIYNHEIAFPNRLFDSVSTGTPIFSFGSRQVADLIEEYNLGVNAGIHVHLKDIGTGLSAMIDNNTEYKDAVIAAQETLSWSSISDPLSKLLNDHTAIYLIAKKRGLKVNRRLAEFKALLNKNISFHEISIKEDVT